MKITGWETFLVEPRWLFLRVDTDAGISGWGEPIVEGRAEAVSAVVDTFFEYLVGRDPRRIEQHWQTLTKSGFYRGGPVFSSAVSGIDQALWDITGRALGAPVHELLGGAVRERARMYTWVHGDDPETLAADAREKTALGFTAVKVNLTEAAAPIPSKADLESWARRMRVLREAVGDTVDVAIDVHGRFSTAGSAAMLPLLEAVRPFFVEEPVLPEHSRNLARLAAATPIPLATGERLYSRREFDEVLRAGVAVVQPDLSHAGGISEVRRIAAAAETFDALLAPHCPLGPIALAASLQVDFATPNFLIQEQSLGIGYGEGATMLAYLRDPSVFDMSAGHIDLLTGPGLGIEIDEDAVREAAATGHRWRPPMWQHTDGSYAEW
ncbi:galactonate dehydratase [Streptomyces sp. CBMA29]|uniref:galactonate dehydratase n=1 Tax=Streptomyces sp. CBMA29 TaxID=1896314 RepID=UPI0016621499|nr:galactonate dehydratase [Streptomyces sp. CBMA29]MBD0737849.1 galactonate dehydratase [Streptomyces sp. CBMA29]